ncbi:receptor-type adenylate cyclase [Trypanosoma grayi]|uniref:receptor-type adenylate cyclase n=1 Tax=Trypanosoma grayi TaxID=71804 RepID=UPI0004F493CA|nr:receptor-type adenylate cyclase [Trypanosoma grayi]KEG11949.1 receptor-type adenylate cyclase [Trypanosoma grayi]
MHRSARQTAWGDRSSLLCVALLLVLLTQVSVAVAQGTNVTVLDVLSTTSPRFNGAVMAYRHGFLAALRSRNYTSGAVRINVVHRDVTVNNIAATVNQASTDFRDLIAALGPTSSPQLLAALPALQQRSVVAFAPLTDGLSTRFWERHFYFFSGETMSSVYTLLRYAMTHLRVLRLGFMYLTGVLYGDNEYILAQQLMAGTHRNISALFQLDSSKPLTASDAEFQAEWERFAETRPQAVIIFGVLTVTTEAFVRKMLTDSRTSGAYLMGPPRLQELLLEVWQDVVKEGGASFRAGQMFTTGTNPMANDVNYKCIERFQAEMSNYLEKSGQKDYNDTQQYLHDDTDGEFMVAGWMAGEVLLQALAFYEPSQGRDGFIASLFAQRRYVIDDFVFGDFGGTIDAKAAAQGAMSECNQGGNLVFLKTFVEGYRGVIVPGGQYTTALTTCYENYTLYDPVLAITYNLTDLGDVASYAVREIVRGQIAAVNPGLSAIQHSYTLKVVAATTAQAADSLIGGMEVFATDVSVGIVLDAMLNAPGLFFLDPVFLTPQLNSFRRNVILLSPTTEQQIFVLAQYLANTSDPAAHVIVRSNAPEATLDVVRRSFLTFGVTLRSATALRATDPLDGRLPASGLTLVINLASREVGVMAAHLEKNKGVRLVVLSTPFSFFYPNFKQLFAGREIADRLLIMTSLPHWDNPQATSTLVSQYHEALPNSTDWSPLSLRNFAASKVIQAAVRQLEYVNSSAISDYFYSRVMVTVGDIVYGPFADANSVTCSGGGASASSCAKNYGATSIAVWTLSRAFDFSVPPLSEGITPSMVYRQEEGGLTRQQLIGVIIGSVVGGLLLIALPVVLMCCCRDSRDNNNAPKNVEDPVTLVFTDIESSTALWAACPEIMPDAVATHHRLIRSLITKYHCYEVKTVGDSFMIASKSAWAAVQLVQDMQQTFLHHDWGTSAIDDAYHEFEEGRAAEDEEYVPPTARLDAAVYRGYWNGLRVRVGVHTGLSDIRHDEVTKGYDYYGGTSNMAARTESVANGGQVLLTRAAYKALSTAEREQLNVTAFGIVPLRGVPKPVEMFQLNAVPGRTFAALRLDREEFLDMDEDGAESEVESSAKGGAMSAHQSPIAALLTDFFMPLPESQRWKVLQTMCERWNVAVPSKKSGSVKDACLEMVGRLAVKLTRVTERRAELLRGEQDVGVGTFLGSIGGNGANRAGGGSVSFQMAADNALNRQSWIRLGSYTSSGRPSEALEVQVPLPFASS